MTVSHVSLIKNYRKLPKRIFLVGIAQCPTRSPAGTKLLRNIIVLLGMLSLYGKIMVDLNMELSVSSCEPLGRNLNIPSDIAAVLRPNTGLIHWQSAYIRGEVGASGLLSAPKMAPNPVYLVQLTDTVPRILLICGRTIIVHCCNLSIPLYIRHA